MMLAATIQSHNVQLCCPAVRSSNTLEAGWAESDVIYALQDKRMCNDGKMIQNLDLLLPDLDLYQDSYERFIVDFGIG